jgi:hypothetical protein
MSKTTSMNWLGMRAIKGWLNEGSHDRPAGPQTCSGVSRLCGGLDSVRIPPSDGSTMRRVVVRLLLVAHLMVTWSAGAALASGAYQTLPGATVREWGDRVPNRSRVVPWFATFIFDLSAGQASLTAVITNAVLEGGEPFCLTARSSSGYQLVDGSYEFLGDYLRDIYPSGTQYLFDWTFSASTNGEALWNGTTGWAGGHLWYVTISNLTLVPVPWLKVSRVSPAAVQIAWATNFADHTLEFTTSLPAVASWSSVTNAVTNSGDRVSVTLDADASHRFYRLRKPQR